MSPFLAELIGTMVLIIFGDGVVATVVLQKSKGHNSGWIVITTGWALAVTIAVYMVGSISGAHLNPAVTIGLAAIGKFSWALVPGYIAAQMLGGFLGGVVVWLAYLPHWGATPDQGGKLAVFCTGPAIRQPAANLLTEIIGTFVLDRTLFGRYLYAVGGNPEAGRRAGIDVAKIRITAFIICSTLAVVSGLLHASRIGSVESTAGRTIVLNGVAAAVVGGVSLFGGRGRMMNAIVGALVISIIDNGLGLIGLPAGINFLVTGGVLVAAATIDALSRKRSGGSILRT